MKRARVRMPIEFDQSARDLGVDIVRNDRQGAVQNTRHIGVAAQKLITERHLLERIKVARVEFDRVFQIANGFIPATLTAVDKTKQFKGQRIVRQSPLGNRNLGASSVVIAIPT